MNNNGNNDWNLIGKYLNDEVDAFEKEQVETWKTESVEFRKEMEKSNQMLNKIDIYYQSQKYNSSKAWLALKADAQTKIRKIKQAEKEKITFTVGLKRFAAAIIILLTLGFIGYYLVNQYQSNHGYLEIETTENQVLKEYLLPDGSSVTLNANTKLRHPGKFKKNEREVFISGEAFFDVVPDPEKPFIIYAGDALVKVLGTSFNVCAYPEDVIIEVLVETGKVQVTRKNVKSQVQSPDVILNTGEKGTLFINENRINKSLNTDNNLLAWKTGLLVFKETPLADVLMHLQKIYHKKIDVKQDELNDLVLTARFDEKPIDFILEVVRLTFDLDLSKNNDGYILSKKPGPQKIQ